MPPETHGGEDLNHEKCKEPTIFTALTASVPEEEIIAVLIKLKTHKEELVDNHGNDQCDDEGKEMSSPKTNSKT